MNQFEEALLKFETEAAALQQREQQVQVDGKVFMDKWMGFLKEAGLPENFSLPQMAALAVRKSRSVIIAP